jgi:tRNA (cytidine/uridine-2'-O-)-methyltransferase
MRLVLYQPDIPQNTGTLMRLGACLGVGIDIVEPCGFPLSDRDLKRAAMDYGASADIARHRSWAHFLESLETEARLVLLSTRGAIPYPAFAFRPFDRLVLGRESAGAGPEVWEAIHNSVTVPMRPGMRSLNVAVSAAMVLGEALRQTDGFALVNGNG